jgi:hypothetical protein
VITGEPENPYDRNAVRVLIREALIGYLPRQAAAVVAPTSRPGRRYEVDAVITGGWDRGGGDVGHYGVRVYLPPPDYI